MAERGFFGRGNLLGFARVVAAGVGTFRGIHRPGSLSVQLLDEQLLGRRRGRDRGCADHGCLGSHG